MKKKLFVIIIGIITILNIIIGSFLFLNIQILETPEIIINVEVTKINSEEAIIKTIIDVNNPNDFEIVIKNFKIVTTTSDGYEVGNLKIKGGEICSNKNNTFIEDFIISFNGHSPDYLTSKITGEIGANILFIQKTIPINIGVITNIDKLINDISAPKIEISVDFEKIIDNGIKINASANIYNPNSFDIVLDEITANIETESKETVGNLIFTYEKIKAKSSSQINCTGFLLFKSLDAKYLIINISGVAGAKLAGFSKNLSFDLKSIINIPNLDKLILSQDNPTFISIRLDEKFTLRGIVFYVTLEINNTYKVDLEARDLVFRVYTVTGDKNNLIGINEKIEDILTKSGGIGSTTCDIIIPYSKILPIDWSTDWIMGSVTGRVGINGINQSAYLEIRGYQSIHPFR